MQEPRHLPEIPQRREPHQPVEPRHVGRHEARPARHVARLPAELVGAPLGPIVAALDHDLEPPRGHVGEEAVAVHHPERPDEAEDRGRGPHPGLRHAQGLEQRHQAQHHQRDDHPAPRRSPPATQDPCVSGVRCIGRRRQGRELRWGCGRRRGRTPRWQAHLRRPRRWARWSGASAAARQRRRAGADTAPAPAG